MISHSCGLWQVDVWALGCVMFSMAFFKMPFAEYGMSAKLDIPSNHNYSAGLMLLLQSMMKDKPEDRASMKYVNNSPFWPPLL